MVNAYAQDLGIQSLELTLVGLVRWDLARSDGCPSLGEKHQDNILAAVITQADVSIQVRRESKIWCFLPDKQFHNCLLPGKNFTPKLKRLWAV